MSDSPRKKKVYDRRLRDFVRETGDIEIALGLGVPKSTISGWMSASTQEVVSHEVFDLGVSFVKTGNLESSNSWTSWNEEIFREIISPESLMFPHILKCS